MKEDLEEILFTADQIRDRVEALARQIADDYKGKTPLLVGVLKGAVIFLADLVRQLDIPLEIDTMAISSYGMSTRSSGVVQILKDLERPIEGRDVLIVEDIVDSGLTLQYLQDSLRRRGAKSVRIAAAFDKPGGRKVDIVPDYYGLTVPNRFVVGYGLDYAEQYRNLPYIGVLRESIYKD